MRMSEERFFGDYAVHYLLLHNALFCCGDGLMNLSDRSGRQIVTGVRSSSHEFVRAVREETSCTKVSLSTQYVL
jgi:hypothetical protein